MECQCKSHVLKEIVHCACTCKCHASMYTCIDFPVYKFVYDFYGTLLPCFKHRTLLCLLSSVIVG